MAQSPTAHFRGKIHGPSDGNLKIGRRTDANDGQAAELNGFVHVNDRKVILYIHYQRLRVRVVFPLLPTTLHRR